MERQRIPGSYMTLGKDRLFVYATTKEQAIALFESENEKGRKFAPKYEADIIGDWKN